MTERQATQRIAELEYSLEPAPEPQNEDTCEFRADAPVLRPKSAREMANEYQLKSERVIQMLTECFH